MGNKSNVLAEYDNKHRLYQNFTSEVKHLLERILIGEKIECNAIVSRLKDRDSLSEKIDRKQDKYKNLGDLTDIAGIRVITYYTEDVDRVAEIVEREFNIDQENSIDKREALEPDRFGYCSLHYVVEMNQNRLELSEYQAFSGLKCEIQIRSVLQHAWAEIEHDLGYKSDIGIPKDIRRNFSRLAGLLEIADKEFQEIRSFLQSYQKEAAEKVECEELLNDEIDVILLKTIIKTDENIIKLNNQIKEICGEDFNSNYDVADIIRKLNWFGIYTIAQLKGFISRNQKIALDIATEFLSKINSNEPGCFDETISLFYLCYAELLNGNYDYDKIIKYLSDNYIGLNLEDKKQNAKELIKLREKLNIPINKK